MHIVVSTIGRVCVLCSGGIPKNDPFEIILVSSRHFVGMVGITTYYIVPNILFPLERERDGHRDREENLSVSASRGTDLRHAQSDMPRSVDALTHSPTCSCQTNQQ